MIARIAIVVCVVVLVAITMCAAAFLAYATGGP